MKKIECLLLILIYCIILVACGPSNPSEIIDEKSSEPTVTDSQDTKSMTVEPGETTLEITEIEATAPETLGSDESAQEDIEHENEEFSTIPQQTKPTSELSVTEKPDNSNQLPEIS